MCPPLVLFCCYDETVTKSSLGRRETIWLILSGHSPSLREVRAETEAETMKEYCLLGHSLVPAQLIFLYSPGPTDQGQCCPQWDRPIHINYPSTRSHTDMATGQCDLGHYSMKPPSSPFMVTGRVKLTMKANHRVLLDFLF